MAQPSPSDLPSPPGLPSPSSAPDPPSPSDAAAPPAPPNPPRRPRILISGASIAGPALARWLGRNGFSVLLVERAPAPRPGGQAVDFKGATHLRLLRLMGIEDAVRAAQTARTDWRIVDAGGEVQAIVPGEFIGGSVEILRGELARILVEASMAGGGDGDVEYRFGEEVVGLDEEETGVAVTFKHAPPARFDLVVGADGVHSPVRRLAFGPEADCISTTGYYYAVSSRAPLAELEVMRPDGRAVAWMYSEPGRSAVLGGPKAPSLFVFRAAAPFTGGRGAAADFLRAHFEGCGWRVPAALDGACADPELYLDAMVRTRLRVFTRGRVALVGDAGYANTLGGFGSGLALLGAYVLAGELVRVLKDHEGGSGGEYDFARALGAYDRAMERPTRIARAGSGGESFLAPPSWWRIRLRNWMFASKWMTSVMLWLAEWFATEEGLPEYDLV